MFTPLRSAAAGLLVLTVLAACAGSADPNGVASLQTQGTGADASASPSASLSPEDAQLAFAQCMREHGVDMPDPQPGGGPQGVAIGDDGGKLTPTEMQAAMDACDQYLQAAGSFKKDIDPAQLDRMIAFAGCMRDHGIDMPDPNVDGNGGMVFRSDGSGTAGSGPSTTKDKFFNGTDPDSPEFKAAEEACRSLLGPDAGPDGGPSVQVGGGPSKP
jgi:hypothetical protein